MDSFLLILNSVKIVFSILLSLWWVYLPIFLFFIAHAAIQNYTFLKYKLSLKWILLEIKVPKEVHKSPKAMEQVFAGLHGIYTVPVRPRDRFLSGKIPDWYSLEMVGRGGNTYFYLRTQEKYKNIVESQIYAQYPEAEVSEVPDYIYDMPLSLPDDKYDLWGAELILNKEDAYPIRTYPEFEEKGGGLGDVKRIDPLASISELFSTLHPSEQMWIQVLAAPTGDDWIKRGQVVLDRLMGKEPAASKGNFLSDMVFAIDKAISNIGPTPTTEDGKPIRIEKKEEKKRVDLSPGKQGIIKAMEESWDKLGYQVSIRFLYLGPKDAFHQAHVSGIMGSFRQFSSQNLNGFKVNIRTMTFARGLFKKSKLFTKKRIMYQAYKERNLFSSGVTRYVLNTEELATIFHFPDVGVRSPLLPRVEAKKGEPPVGLPIM